MDQQSNVVELPIDQQPAMSEKARKRMERRKQKGNKGRYRPKLIEPKTFKQRELLECLRTGNQVFAVGEAGTGKTWISGRVGIQKLKTGQVERILIARPTVSEVRHKQGFLPGHLNTKLAPWLVPILDAFKAEISATEVEKYLRSGDIEFLSFEHMRGRTFSNAFVILDEAQNCSFNDLRMFLTRKGEGTTYVVTGDPSQVDIQDSGLASILDMIEQYDLDADIIEFESSDVVRSEQAQEWVSAFQKWTKKHHL